MIYAGETPRQLLASRKWRSLHSIWVWPVGLFGLCTAGSFLYIGLRVKNRAYLISAGVYAVATVALFVLIAMSGPTDEEVTAGAVRTHTQDIINDWIAGYLLTLWIAGIVHALLVRPTYLEQLANRTTRKLPTVSPLYANPVVPQQHPTWIGDAAHGYWGPAAAMPGTAPTDATHDYWDRAAAAPGTAVSAPTHPRPGGSPIPAQWPRSLPSATPKDHGPSESPAGAEWARPWPLSTTLPTTVPPTDAPPTKVRVHSATAAEFATLGLSEQAIDAVIAARSRPGGIRTLTDFAAVTQLKPHVLQMITDLLDFSDTPVDQPVRALGRRLDL